MSGFPYNFRPEVDNDVISGSTVEHHGIDVCVKFGDSRSNGFRDIRGTDFESNERTVAKPIPIARNTAFGVSQRVILFNSMMCLLGTLLIFSHAWIHGRS